MLIRPMSKPSVKEILKTNIYIASGFFDSTFCDDCIKFIEKRNNKERDTYLIDGYMFYLTEKKEDEKIDYEVYKRLRKVVGAFKDTNTYIQVHGDIQYHFRKLVGPTALHTDIVRSSGLNYLTNQVRSVGVIVNLNDDYEGGEFEFPHQSITVKLKKGEVLLFPPFWTHPHQVNDVSSPRYTITTWFTEDIVS